jgi:hypothetical protein
LDYAFPGSKFILSVRDNEDQWYESFMRFHRKRLGIQDRPIVKEDLLNDPYRHKGFVWDANSIIYSTPEKDPFNEGVLKEHYLRHNEDVITYFRFRNELLVINLKDLGSYQRFCAFLGVEPVYEEFPWLNRSR